LKLDYNYFLKRRKLTTHSLIKRNEISSYEELVTLLKRLKVAPPSEVVFNSALNEINMHNNTKDVKDEPAKQKKNTKQSKVGSASRKRKSTQAKSTRKTRNSSISKT
jgi:hypothetical protein